MAATADDLRATPAAQQRRDPLEILAEQDLTRLPDLVPVRYQRMRATPFTHYRGAAAVMAADQAATPNSGVYTWLCGDAHLSNFGLYFSPERRLVFDINDFDETHPGPFEWDVKRLAASLVVAAQGNGVDDRTARKAARRAARAYRDQMAESAEQSAVACWYDHADAEDASARLAEHLDTASTANLAKILRKSRHRNSDQALVKLCTATDDGVRIRSDPPLLIPASEVFVQASPGQLEELFWRLFTGYRESLPPQVATVVEQYTFAEAARKVVGVGSVGTRCWIALFTDNELGDPFFLQLKEARESVLAPYVGSKEFANQGQRVVFGQQLLQAYSDIFLGYMRSAVFSSDQHGVATTAAGEADFYVRQLRDGKGSAVIEVMPIENLAMYGELCGRVLAKAHARTAGRGDIARYLDDLGKSFDKAIADWALAYSEINLADHQRMLEAIAAGDIQVADLEA